MELARPALSPTVIDFSLAAERILSPTNTPILSEMESRLIQHYAHQLATIPLPVRTVDVWGRRED